MPGYWLTMAVWSRKELARQRDLSNLPCLHLTVRVRLNRITYTPDRSNTAAPPCNTAASNMEDYRYRCVVCEAANP
jgi:hypothetical protein